MSENGHDMVVRVHREAVERYREQKARQKALVEATHREAVEYYRKQKEEGRSLVEAVHRAALERAQGQPVPPPPEPATIHYTELPEAKPDSPLYHEWNCYRREAGRLLAEGQEGRHVLIKGENIIGLWDTHDEALAAGYQHFPGQAFLVHQIQQRERLIRNLETWRCRIYPFRFGPGN